ncbi:hypothetical protein evm_008340 [Chilo suppressalis]|nr:hypothetical protein evm_008340 [Chilo suppressalis]
MTRKFLFCFPLRAGNIVFGYIVVANHCLVSTFFGYSFLHLFLTVGLVVWEALSAGWIQLGLVLASDLLLIICLFSVKYLMEAIRTGNIYSRPGEPINVSTAGAQAFAMGGIGKLGHEPPRRPSADWRVLTTADAAGTNGLTCLPKHGGDRGVLVTHPMTDQCESC